MNKQYHLSIRYFLFMMLMLLSTGIWLLLLHSSLSLESFTNYYVEKSLFGLLEVVTPHLFAMGTVVFVLTHFLALDKKNTTFEHTTTLTLFTFMLLSNLSGFFITESTSYESTNYMVWLKIISTLMFLSLSLLTMWRVVVKLSKYSLSQ